MAGEGVGEGELLGVEVETVGRETVEGVAKDGTAETLRVGTMQTKLVGAARVGSEQDTLRVVGSRRQWFAVGHGGLAMQGVDYLARTVERVRTQGERDGEGELMRGEG